MNLSDSDSDDKLSEDNNSAPEEPSYSFSNKRIKLQDSEEDTSNSDVEKSKPKKSSKSDFAKKYMKNYGYKEGSGLGKYGTGIKEPVKASDQKGKRGLGFEPENLKQALAKYDPADEKIYFDEEVEWLKNNYSDSISYESLKDWLRVGPQLKKLDLETNFCDYKLFKNMLNAKTVFDDIGVKDLENARARSNPFETIRGGIFLNRAAMKMANMDAILDRMFTDPKTPDNRQVVGQNELLYFADVCAGPGGFSEYVLFRKKWLAKGFGFTLKEQNNFLLDQFWAGPSESFTPVYGADDDGDVYKPQNIQSFREYVMKHTKNKGVHFMMADGGVHIGENKNDQELICKKLYLCQCLISLLIVRTGGHFVVKLFDLFTSFSIGLVYLMYRSFREISIIKPNTSRPANSERYLVCKWKREDCKDIARHLFEVNKEVPEYTSQKVSDVLELVPVEILLKDEEFCDYLKKSNNSLAQRQTVALTKMATYTENSYLIDERQQDLRTRCLSKWDIPDKARTEPVKSDPRTKFTELVGNSNICETDSALKKELVSSVEDLRKRINTPFSWHCIVFNRDDGVDNINCFFYLGTGRNNVFWYDSKRWNKIKSNDLYLPADTLVYGSILQEFRGEGPGQIKLSAFHIIDGLFLGKKNIAPHPLHERLKMCKLFAESLNSERFPIRVANQCPLENIGSLLDSLELKKTKSIRVSRPCISLDENSFFKVGGIMFIKHVRDPWDQYYSKSHKRLYFFNAKNGDKFFSDDKSNPFADLESSFRNRMFWLWDEGVVVHKDQNCEPHYGKLQGEQLKDFVASLSKT